MLTIKLKENSSEFVKQAQRNQITNLLQSVHTGHWVIHFELDKPLGTEFSEQIALVRCAFIDEDIMIHFDDFVEFYQELRSVDCGRDNLLRIFGFERPAHQLRSRPWLFDQWIPEYCIGYLIRHLRDTGEIRVADILESFMLGVIEDAEQFRWGESWPEPGEHPTLV